MIRFSFLPFIVFFIAIDVLCAQKSSEEDTRKTEAQIKIEDKFVEAKFLIVAGKKLDAIKLLDTIRRESDVQNAAVYFELAKLHYELKDINQTESSIKTAIKLQPENIWMRLFEVKFSTDLGRYDDAIESMKYLISIDQKNSEHYDHLVNLYIKKNELEKALSILDLKEKNIGFQEKTILQKAEILDNAGNIIEAVSQLSRLTAKYPNEKKYLRLIVNMLHANDKVAEAEPFLKKIVELDPNDSDAKLGLILLSNKKISEEDYLITLHPLMGNQDVPVDVKIKELIKYVEKHANSQDSILGHQLIDLCDKLILTHPEDPKAHAIFGDVLMNNGEITAAIRQYEKTLLLSKKNYLVWEQLMYGLDIMENYDRLFQIATDAIEYFPNQPMSYYFSGKALIAKNDFLKAEALLDEASMISSGNINIESRVLAAKGEIYFKKKDFSKSLQFVNQSITVSSEKNTNALELKGDIYKEQNDMTNAVVYWTKSKESGNVSQRLKDKLKMTIGN